MKIGDVDCHRPARIDEYDPHFRPLLPHRSDSLIKHRVAPGEIGPDQHDEVREFEASYVPGTTSAPKALRWPATEEAMQRRELVSMLADPMKPFISLLAT